MNKKIRNAQLNQVSFIGVIGQDEVDNGTIDVRDRDSNSSIGKLTVNGFVAFLNSHLPKPSEAKEKMVSKAYYEETIEVTHKYSQKELNDTLERTTFLLGEEISAQDWLVFKAIEKLDQNKYPHLFRWFNHLKSISS